MTCQDVSVSYQKAFEAASSPAKHFQWTPSCRTWSMPTWASQMAAGLRYYGIPASTSRTPRASTTSKPGEDHAFMKEDEYDELIKRPDRFLWNVWLRASPPRR